MTKQIVWSHFAENDFDKILDYLNLNWNEAIANQFIDLTEHTLKQISIDPKLFPFIDKRSKIRKCVLTRHNSMFYRITENQIQILRIYDTRQDPVNLIFKQPDK
jgi:plasmid stabilization system protein ParE